VATILFRALQTDRFRPLGKRGISRAGPAHSSARGHGTAGHWWKRWGWPIL